MRILVVLALASWFVFAGCGGDPAGSGADPDFLWNMYVAEGIGPASFIIEEADSNSFSHMELKLESFLIN